MNTLTSIGNDIVDLRDDDCRATLSNVRFLERVFTENERADIARSQRPGQYLWSVWACKESAYKALKRLRPEVIFSHRQFETQRGLLCVVHERREISCSVEESDEFVFATAVINGKIENIQSLHSRGGHPVKNDSVVVRQLLVNLAADYFSTPRDGLHVSIDDAGAPLLMRGAELISAAVSLTHHGRYCAASLYKNVVSIGSRPSVYNA